MGNSVPVWQPPPDPPFPQPWSTTNLCFVPASFPTLDIPYKRSRFVWSLLRLTSFAQHCVSEGHRVVASVSAPLLLLAKEPSTGGTHRVVYPLICGWARGLFPTLATGSKLPRAWMQECSPLRHPLHMCALLGGVGCEASLPLMAPIPEAHGWRGWTQPGVSMAPHTRKASGGAWWNLPLQQRQLLFPLVSTLPTEPT